MTAKKSTQILLLTFIIATLTLFALKFYGYRNKEDKGFIGYCGRLLNKTNNFNLTYNNIDEKDVDVVWRSEDGVTDTLVRKGVKKDNINYEYGAESFSICYRDTALTSVGFFSANNNDPHDVEINITKMNNRILVNCSIDGEKSIVYNNNH